jgi:hypothetical protein
MRGRYPDIDTSPQKGILMVELMQQDQKYQKLIETLNELHRVIENKWHLMLRPSVVLLHESVHPHISTAARTQAQQEDFNWELFGHTPNSPDLDLSDYRLFIYLKNGLQSQRFNNNED